jgi:hypothetical protein
MTEYENLRRGCGETKMCDKPHHNSLRIYIYRWIFNIYGNILHRGIKSGTYSAAVSSLAVQTRFPHASKPKEIGNI